MELSTLLLAVFSIIELALLFVVILFFVRLKKSEALLSHMQSNQEAFVNKLRFNAQLEQELMESFKKRQAELQTLDEELERKSEELRKLIKQAQEFTRSPQFLRQLILSGHREGKSTALLAQKTGLSAEEVELIIEQQT